MAGKDEEPAEIGTGMETRDLKKLLLRARQGPVACALAQGDAPSGGLALVLLDKIMPPKQVLAALRKQFPTSKTPCFGTASVDRDADPKLVTFKMNKRIPGLDRRLRKTLKGTGFSKVAIKTGQASEER